MATIHTPREHLRYLLMLRRYLFSAFAVILTTAICWHFKIFLGSPSILLLYTLQVFLVAYSFGLGPSILSVIYSVSAFAFFFAPPIYSFAVNDPHTFIALVVLLVVATVTSSLMQRLRDQIQLSERNALQTAALLDLSVICSNSTHFDSLALELANLLSRRLSLQSSVWLLDEPLICEAYTADKPLHNLPGTWHPAAIKRLLINPIPGLPGTKDPEGGRYLLMKTDERIVGIVRLDPEHEGVDLTPDQEAFLEDYIEQMANQINQRYLKRMSHHPS